MHHCCGIGHALGLSGVKRGEAADAPLLASCIPVSKLNITIDLNQHLLTTQNGLASFSNRFVILLVAPPSSLAVLVDFLESGRAPGHQRWASNFQQRRI